MRAIPNKHPPHISLLYCFRLLPAKIHQNVPGTGEKYDRRGPYLYRRLSPHNWIWILVLPFYRSSLVTSRNGCSLSSRSEGKRVQLSIRVGKENSSLTQLTRVSPPRLWRRLEFPFLG
ncbi:uncharacterized protein LOC119766118 [Culex quinquefasciatus]|uniref:uncharacterized protein LOC119766118 n=1 Tax=Culex quinquefasciatus TaxID=7176 RepID=UPI0018E35654|nr:uncharacterized protein LOC119766118 [Culex quinquefasciatus]